MMEYPASYSDHHLPSSNPRWTADVLKRQSGPADTLCLDTSVCLSGLIELLLEGVWGLMVPLSVSVREVVQSSACFFYTKTHMLELSSVHDADIVITPIKT